VDNVIRLVDARTRKHLRKALGGYEKTANVGTLISVLGNEDLNLKVRKAAMAEITRRYLVSVKDLAGQLIGRRFTVEEKLFENPVEAMSQRNGEIFAEKHAKRADLWIRLFVQSSMKSEAATSWLALSLHHRQLSIDFESVKALVAASPKEAKVPFLKEAMYGFGENTVWVGLKWPFDGVRVNVPPSSPAFTNVTKWVVTPFFADCTICKNRIETMSDGRLRCPGTDYPRPPSVVMANVAENGCASFENENEPVRRLHLEAVAKEQRQ
jgi:hypothetical protein